MTNLERYKIKPNTIPVLQNIKIHFLSHTNVDPKQFQEYKNVVAEKLHILKGITDINIKEVFFKPYTNENIIALIDMEIKTMDLVRAINEYVRADASLYLKWNNDVRYDRFDSQMLSQYRQEEPNKENIEDVKQIILNEYRNGSLNNCYKAETERRHS